MHAHRHAQHPEPESESSSTSNTSTSNTSSTTNAQCPAVGPTLTGNTRNWLTQWTGQHAQDTEGFSAGGYLADPNPLERRASLQGRQAGTQSRTAYGANIEGTDVSPDAVDATERVAAALFGGREDIAERIAEANVRLQVIPSDQRLTDVRGLDSLENTCTADGTRNWNDVRGSGGTQVGDEWVVSVPEEGLIDVNDGTDWALHEQFMGYGPRHSVAVHEIAHILHTQGLTDEDRERIQEMWQSRTDAGDDFTSDYASSNALEYFAESVNAYLDVNSQIDSMPGADLAAYGEEWLERHDPDMHAMLEGILGTQEEAFDRARAVDAPTPAEATEGTPAPSAPVS